MFRAPTDRRGRNKTKTPETGVSGVFFCFRAVHRIIDRPVQVYDEARVAPNIQSSGGTDGRIFEFPRITHPSAVPKVKLRVAPNPLVVKLRRLSSLRVAPHSASTAGSMMNPRQSSNFASSACAADESSCPFRSRQTWYGFLRFVNLDPSIHYRQADHEFPYRNPYLRFLPRQCCRSNQLQSHQLVRDIRPTQPVDASAKPQCFLWISPFMVHSHSNSTLPPLISDLHCLSANDKSIEPTQNKCE